MIGAMRDLDTMRDLTIDELKAVSGGAGECGRSGCTGRTHDAQNCPCPHPPSK
jgi:hypothetical protein